MITYYDLFQQSKWLIIIFYSMILSILSLTFYSSYICSGSTLSTPKISKQSSYWHSNNILNNELKVMNRNVKYHTSLLWNRTLIKSEAPSYPKYFVPSICTIDGLSLCINLFSTYRFHVFVNKGIGSVYHRLRNPLLNSLKGLYHCRFKRYYIAIERSPSWTFNILNKFYIANICVVLLYA